MNDINVELESNHKHFFAVKTVYALSIDDTYTSGNFELHFLPFMWKTILSLTLLFVGSSLCFATDVSKVVISEVMWMGSDVSTADEWVEIVAIQQNHSDHESDIPLSLSGWTLTRLKDGEEIVIVEFGDITIGSGEYILVSNYAESESRLSIEPNVITKDIVLSNTQLLLRLRDAAGTLVDSVDDGVGEPFAGRNDAPKASMERVDLAESGESQANWQTSTESKGFDDGALIYGTPGFANIISPHSIPPTLPEIPTTYTLPAVFITELLPDPDGSDNDLEWIEIGNTGTGFVDLSGWIIGVGDAKKHVIGSGYSLLPGAFAIFSKPDTGLSLKNSGDFVQLFSGSVLADSWSYPVLPEGISYGRDDSGGFAPFCVPTPGMSNTGTSIGPIVEIQSGILKDWNKVTINLRADVLTGSLVGAVCDWDFGDGYVSDSCNPPVHSFKNKGKYNVVLDITSYCGDIARTSVEVEVLGEGVYQEPVYILEEKSCNNTSSTGITIVNFLPDPKGKDADLEWIDIYNATVDMVNLCGWSLDDADGGSDPFQLDDYEIEGEGVLRLPITETKITLNNDGDSVRLFFDGDLIQEIVYEKMKEGEMYGNDVPLPEGEDKGEVVKQEEKQHYSFEVLLNEIFPAPKKGGQEYVELFNPTAHEVDLSGWIIDDIRDGGSKPWIIPDRTRIASGSYLVFFDSATTLRLNNDGDEVWLIVPDGSASGSVSYGKVKKETSISRIAGRGRWCVGLPTPMTDNHCDTFSLASFSSSSSKSSLLSSSQIKEEETLGLGERKIRVVYQNASSSRSPIEDSMLLDHPIVKEKPHFIYSALRGQVIDDIKNDDQSRGKPVKDAEPIIVALGLMLGLHGLRLKKM
jgi:hypothetical protein